MPRSKDSLIWSLKTIILLSLTILLSRSQSGCTEANASNILGCISCDTTGNEKVYNRSSMKFTCIDSTLNCIEIQTNSNCSICKPGFVLQNGLCNAPPNNLQGCLRTEELNTNRCVQCNAFYVLENGTCRRISYSSIPYCAQLDNTNTCIQCLSKSLSPSTNCSQVDPLFCQIFDWNTFYCVSCPENQTIHSSQDYCVEYIENCQIYSDSGCQLCEDSYIVDPNGLSCSLIANSVTSPKSQLLTPPTTTTLCLSTVSTPTVVGTEFLCVDAPGHCRNGSPDNCLQCIDGYYESNGRCLECGIQFPNCAICSSNNSTQLGCDFCNYGFYLSEAGRCMKCEGYGCRHCMTGNQLNNINQEGVQCLSCQEGFTLYKGACFQCQEGNSFSPVQGKCLPCSLNVTQTNNCSHCYFTGSSTRQAICLECSDGFYISTTFNLGQLPTSSCQSINQIKSLSDFPPVLNRLDRIKLIQKLLPGMPDYSFIYSQSQSSSRLELASCNSSTDGYICLCTNVTLSSLCTPLHPLTPTPQPLQLNEPVLVRLIAQYLNYSLQTNVQQINTTTFCTVSQFNAFVAAVSVQNARNLLSNNYNSANYSSINSLVNQIRILWNNLATDAIFSDQRVTKLQGNGYVFFNVPSNQMIGPGELIQTQPVNFTLGFYVAFDRQQNISSATGRIYVFSTNTTVPTPTSLNVRVKKTRYTTNLGQPIVFVNGAPGNTQVSYADGYYNLSIPVFSNISSPSTQIRVSGDGGGELNNFESQRIQMIFDSQSWIYILFFVLMYLIFIPLCSMVDCCDPKHNLRKRVGTEQSEQGQQQQSDDTTVVKINYREFFPLYNIGNTPRPRRLQKLCLFIVNMQHCITFLTLIYFRFQGGHEVVAIVLVIPAYLCTVVMGYICGAIFRHLPGNFKYLINIFSIGYWIMWIFLMRIMSRSSSHQYWPYLLTFAILCNVLDLIIDSLEMLLVYFALRQQQQQVGLYRCLARWLSLRGFYQYDKLAKQIGIQDQ